MRKTKIPTNIRPDEVTAVVDKKEGTPLDLGDMETVPGALDVGRYSLPGLEHVVAIDRKTLGDLVSCVGYGRPKFERDLQQMLVRPVRAVVVETTWSTIEASEWKSRIKPDAVIGSVFGWMAMGLPFVMAGDRDRAGRFVARLLLITARRRWRESVRLFSGVVKARERDLASPP